jgi:hypothetical protein
LGSFLGDYRFCAGWTGRASSEDPNQDQSAAASLQGGKAVVFHEISLELGMMLAIGEWVYFSI